MNKKHYLILVLFFSLCSLILTPAGGESEKSIREIKINNAAIEDKNVTVYMEKVEAKTGSTVGFRIEVINRSADKDLIVYVYDDLSILFEPCLYNKEGSNISPLLESMPNVHYASDQPKNYRYDFIFPQASHVWFIPVPKQMQYDPTKVTNENNIVPIFAGEYIMEMNISFGYFLQEKKKMSIPKYPKYETFFMKMPKILIKIGSESLSKDVFETYIENISISNKENE